MLQDRRRKPGGMHRDAAHVSQLGSESIFEYRCAKWTLTPTRSRNNVGNDDLCLAALLLRHADCEADNAGEAHDTEPADKRDRASDPAGRDDRHVAVTF